MIIKYKDYLLQQEEDRFNLYLNVVRTKQDTNETYIDKKDIGFGYHLETGIKTIILHELNNNNSVVSLKEFLTEYNKIKVEVLSNIVQ